MNEGINKTSKELNDAGICTFFVDEEKRLTPLHKSCFALFRDAKDNKKFSITGIGDTDCLNLIEKNLPMEENLKLPKTE